MAKTKPPSRRACGTITIISIPWRLFAVDRPSFRAVDGDLACAECDGFRKTITIAVGTAKEPVSQRVVRKRLLHEMGHAVAGVFEEQHVEAMADAVEDNDLGAATRRLLDWEK